MYFNCGRREQPIGADNALIYKKFLGYGPSKLEDLKNKGVI